MDGPPDVEHPGVTRVKEMYDHGDFETIDKMVRWWTALENLGALGGLLYRFIVWSGVIAAGYLAVNGYISDWIRSVAKQ